MTRPREGPDARSMTPSEAAALKIAHATTETLRSERDRLFNTVEQQAARIQELEDTVDKLREIAVEDRAKQIYPYTMPSWEHLPEEDYREKIIGSDKSVIAPGKKKYREAAEMQLQAEHPEVFQ